MSTLMIVGGVHGVGKTTLIGNLLCGSRPGTTFLDPGALFNKHVWQDKDRTVSEVEDLVVAKLVAQCHTCNTKLVLASWHWAVWTPLGYVPQISIDRWRLVVRASGATRVHLVNVTAPAETILTRRVRDYANHPRKRSLDAVSDEMVASDEQYECFADAIERFATVLRHEVKNVGIESALDELKNLYTHAYETA